MVKPSEPGGENCHGVIGDADEAGQNTLKYPFALRRNFAELFHARRVIERIRMAI